MWGPRLGAACYLELMAHDKKVEAGKLRLVLLREVGRAVIHGEAAADDIAAAIGRAAAEPRTHSRASPLPRCG